MQQETLRPENSEETLTLENTARETIFTMVGVLSVVFLAMLDQFCLEAGDTLNDKPVFREEFSFAC